MHTLLGRNLHFIAWSNFGDPQVYAMWIRAFAGLLVCIYPAWLLGRLVAGARRYESATEELTVGLTVGLGAVVVPLFLMASAGGYSRIPLIALALLVGGAVVWSAGSRGLLAPFLVAARAIREHPWLWAMFLVASLPALLPPTRVDETGYHLAQVQQWLQHGSLVVDPYSVYPLYTNNWHLVMGAGMLFGGVPVVHMLTWCAGVLTTLWILVLLQRSAVSATLRAIAALALFVTPLVQRYLTNGLVDIPLMLYLTASVALILQIDREEERNSVRDLLPAAICVGMFTGMKILNFAFAPLFVALALTKLRPRRVATLALLSIAVGSLWYARNLVLVGDPAPPMLHHALGMTDPYWTPEDVRRLGADIKRGLSWAPFAARIPTDDTERWRFETDWTPSASLLDALARVAAPGDTIYSLGVTHLKYYFERRGYPLIGYEFHRGRYPDLARAIAANRTGEFFQDLPARYVVVDTATAGRALALTGTGVLKALDAAPALQRVADPALGAVYRVKRPTAENPL